MLLQNGVLITKRVATMHVYKGNKSIVILTKNEKNRMHAQQLFLTFIDNLSTKFVYFGTTFQLTGARSSQGELLWVAFCPATVVHRAWSVNIFSSVTSRSIGMKLHRKHSLNDLTRIPSNIWDPCRILVSMVIKRNKLKHSSSPKLVGRFANNFVEMFLG